MIPTNRFRLFNELDNRNPPRLQQWFTAEIGEPFRDHEASFRELRHSGGFWIDVPIVRK